MFRIVLMSYRAVFCIFGAEKIKGLLVWFIDVKTFLL